MFFFLYSTILIYTRTGCPKSYETELMSIWTVKTLLWTFWFLTSHESLPLRYLNLLNCYERIKWEWLFIKFWTEKMGFTALDLSSLAVSRNCSNDPIVQNEAIKFSFHTPQEKWAAAAVIIRINKTSKLICQNNTKNSLPKIMRFTLAPTSSCNTVSTTKGVEAMQRCKTMHKHNDFNRWLEVRKLQATDLKPTGGLKSGAWNPLTGAAPQAS